MPPDCPRANSPKPSKDSLDGTVTTSALRTSNDESAPSSSVSAIKTASCIDKEALSNAELQPHATQPEQLNIKISFLSLCSIALTTGESWVALGNSLSLAVSNGGAPGVIYAFIADSACYWLVAAAVAELASAMPSTATAYVWARTTAGPRYGHLCSWFAGFWLWATWILGPAALVSFLSLQILGIVEVWSTPELSSRGGSSAVPRWLIFAVYQACNWAVVGIVLFAEQVLDKVNRFGLLISIGGWFISLVLCASGPAAHGKAYASAQAVWRDWQNETGWNSQAFVFCLGMLNAALAVGAPDISCHMAEEVPKPSRTLPQVILLQYVASFVTGLTYLVTLFYAVPDLAALSASSSVYPLAQLYLAATDSSTATALLLLAFLPTSLGASGAFAIAGRQAWALAREGILPYAPYLATLNVKTNNPKRTIFVAGCLTSLLGILYLVSDAAFDALAGSFVVFASLSYLAALVPYVLSGRRYVPDRGWWWIPGWLGLSVSALACVYLAAFIPIFCFPQAKDSGLQGMNWTSVVVGGWTIAVASWRVIWLRARR